ncbi:hypothetical protein BASA83_011623 [Batrachochytrium salamandrivorans]|nr:hypothetical protein BASA83_011623 [Batrachochytrium salamandrivorans]
MTLEESETYLQIQAIDKHRLFFKREDRYFKSEYHSVGELGKGDFGIAHLATKKSSGLEVVYKIIEKEDVEFYTLESSPPSECHGIKIPTLYGKHAGARCMSPRPQNLLLPFEVKVQEYLSQPGYGSPHVPRVIDYIVTEKKYILVMEYSGEDWVGLNRYIMKHGKFSMNETGSVKLIDFGLSQLLEGWNQDNSVQAESSDSASGSSGGKPDSGPAEISDMKDIGDLLYRLLTLKTPPQDSKIPREEIVEELRNKLDDFEFQPAVNAVDLVSSLYKCGSYRIATIDDILGNPFFKSQ